MLKRSVPETHKNFQVGANAVSVWKHFIHIGSEYQVINGLCLSRSRPRVVDYRERRTVKGQSEGKWPYLRALICRSEKAGKERIRSSELE